MYALIQLNVLQCSHTVRIYYLYAGIIDDDPIIDSDMADSSVSDSASTPAAAEAKKDSTSDDQEDKQHSIFDDEDKSKVNG